MNLSFLNFFRALSFGGLLGCGLAGLIYMSYPNLFVNVIGIKTFVAFGGFLGAGFQQLIETTVKFVLRPLSDLIIYYEKLVELSILKSTGRISQGQYQAISYKLTEQRFLGKEPGTITLSTKERRLIND